MSPRRVLLTAITASLLVLAAPVAAAQATSCVGTEEVLVGAKAAFIGVVTGRDGEQLTFDVSDVFRGDLPDPFFVREDIPSAGAADPFRVGAEVGLVVYQRDGELLINECGVVPLARLHQARAEGWSRGLLYPRRRLLAARGDSAGLTVFAACTASGRSCCSPTTTGCSAARAWTFAAAASESGCASRLSPGGASPTIHGWRSGWWSASLRPESRSNIG